MILAAATVLVAITVASTVVVVVVVVLEVGVEVGMLAIVVVIASISGASYKILKICNLAKVAYFRALSQKLTFNNESYNATSKLCNITLIHCSII